MECRLLSLQDSSRMTRMAVGNREVVFTGRGRGKARFSASAAHAARRRAKVVVAGHPFLAPVARGTKFFARKAKSVVWTHGLEVWEPLSILRRRALRNADLVIAPTNDTANHVATQQDIPRERIRVLPRALDPQLEALLSAKPAPALPGNFPTGRG